MVLCTVVATTVRARPLQTNKFASCRCVQVAAMETHLDELEAALEDPEGAECVI
jgi:hypothetical protein